MNLHLKRALIGMLTLFSFGVINTLGVLIFSIMSPRFFLEISQIGALLVYSAQVYLIGIGVLKLYSQFKAYKRLKK